MPDLYESFDALVADVIKLNPKYLEQLILDLRTRGYIAPWSGDYHRMLQHRVEIAILERTVLR